MDTDIRVGATASYNADDYWEESVVFGILNIIEAFGPLIVYYWIIDPLYGKMETNPVFMYAWDSMANAHIGAWSLTALVWPFTYIKGAPVFR